MLAASFLVVAAPCFPEGSELFLGIRIQRGRLLYQSRRRFELSVEIALKFLRPCLGFFLAEPFLVFAVCDLEQLFFQRFNALFGVVLQRYLSKACLFGPLNLPVRDLL